MSKGRHRRVRYSVPKGGSIIEARFSGPETFSAQKSHPLLPPERVFAADTESLVKGGKLTTLLIPVCFHDQTLVIETSEGKHMMGQLLRLVLDRWGEPSTQQADARNLKLREDCEWRPGHKELTPVLSVWFNLAYDFGRLLADHKFQLRFVASGADTYRMRVTKRIEFDVSRMFFGSSSSFDWTVRDLHTGRAVRLLGADLTGYWKTSLRNAAKAVGVQEKIDIESQIENVYGRTFESLSEREWRLFRDYAAGDAETTLQLYHKTVHLLLQIDEGIVRDTGTVPPSAPGAAAKIVFRKAFECHPEVNEWPRYRAWADRLGCLAYAGGRCFSSRPGIYQRMVSLDLKSAYPFQMACLPDLVELKTRPVKERDGFDPELFRGRYGILVIDGEGLDPVYPALRIRDTEHKRMRYVYGRFQKIAATIPEIAIGVARGVLRVDRIRRGVVLEGSPERSFFRRAMRAFIGIKEDKANEKPLREMAKLMANSTYGKLMEVQTHTFFLAEGLPMPQFKEPKKVAEALVRAFVSAGPPPEALYWGEGSEEGNASEARSREKRGGGGGARLRRAEGTLRLDPDKVKAAHAHYNAELEQVGGDMMERALHAVRIYVEAMLIAQMPIQRPGLVPVGAYVRAVKIFQCGHYFMPAMAAQITGATSAYLGAMAGCLGAYQGDTDSVHVPLPENVNSALALPGFSEYFAVMDRAGYMAPRLIGETWVGIEGIESLGGWVEETVNPSTESVLVRPKVYSHKFRDNEYKQAKHGYARFHSPAIEAKLRDASIPIDERLKEAAILRHSELHEAMKRVHLGEVFEYETRPAPRRLRSALITGQDVGEFVSRPIKISNISDPNTHRDVSGRVLWKPLEE